MEVGKVRGRQTGRVFVRNRLEKKRKGRKRKEVSGRK